MRDILVFAIVFGSLPYVLLRPYYGLLLFTWLAYMRPNDLTWGPAQTFRFSLLTALVMFIGWFLFDKRRFMKPDVRTYSLLGLVVMVSIGYWHAPIHNTAITGDFVQFLKIIAIALFATGQVDSKYRVRMLLIVIALSLGFFGVKGGLWGLLSPGARIKTGPGGLLLDNNDFSLAMVMNLPLLLYLSFSESNRKFRIFLRAAFFLTIFTVVLTTSRGGTLAMACVFLALLVKSRYRLLALPLGFLAVMAAFALAPADYRERMATIKTAADEDQSAMGRLRAWAVAMEVVNAYPVLGVGFGNFMYNYSKFDREVEKSVVRVAHNSYLQIWAETGSISFFLFLFVIFSTLYILKRLQRVARVRDGPSWIYFYSSALEVSLYGFLVGATFLNRGHFDLLYMVIAVSISLHYVAMAELRAGKPTEQRGGGGVVVREGDPFLAGRGAG